MVSEKRLKRSLYLFYSAYRWAFLAYCVYQLILILLEFTSMGLERYKFLIAYWAPLNLKIALEETYYYLLTQLYYIILGVHALFIGFAIWGAYVEDVRLSVVYSVGVALYILFALILCRNASDYLGWWYLAIIYQNIPLAVYPLILQAKQNGNKVIEDYCLLLKV